MAAQTNFNGNIVASEDSNSEKKWSHKKDAPHEEFFGNLYGITIWNVIREALFPTEWWAILISVILGIGTFVGFIKFLEKHNQIMKFEYKVKGEDLVGIIIGMIVVNALAHFLFNNAWWAQIMVVSVSITFVKTLYEVIVKEIQKSQPKPLAETTISQPISTEQPKTQTIQPKSACPNCGFDRTEESKYCIGCGYKF